MVIPNELEVEEIDDIVETKDDEGNDLTDWKALALKNQGIAKRYKTKIEKIRDAKKDDAVKISAPEKKEPEKKEGFDYAEKAFLKASSIQSDEYDFVLGVIKSTGKTLDEVLESKYFQNELKEKRELTASKNAIPSGSPRASTGARDTTEYWVAKGELPPLDQPELRRQVVNARIKNEEAKTKFTSKPVA